MLNNINELISTITTSFTQEADSIDNKSIFILSGGFGTGKSYLTENISNQLIENKLADCIINIKNINRYTFLTELMASTAYTIKTENQEYISDYGSEAEYNNVQFKSFLSSIKKEHSGIYNAYCLSAKLKSQYEWAENYKAIKDNDSQISSFIKELFPKKGEQRLLFETYTIAVESLIVDLMNIFYPITDSENPIIMKSDVKRKIFISIDEIDSINGSMYYFFLNYLIPYFYTKTFGEFVSYHISFIDSNIKISDFFDFKILFSSRNDFVNVNNNILTNLLPFVLKTDLKNITYKEFETSNFSEETKSIVTKEVFDYTCGVPALINNILPIKNNDSIYEWVLGEAYQLITKDLSSKEIDYLHLLSITDVLDNSLLKYFDKYKFNTNQLKNFLLFNPNLCDNNKEKCSDLIKYFISEYLKKYNNFEYNYLINISNAIEKVKSILEKYSDEEFELIKTLSFLNDKDDKLVFTLFAKDYEETWERLYKKDMELFPKSKHQINSNTAETIREFVKSINIDEYNTLNSLYDELSKQIKANERAVQSRKEEYLQSIQSELKDLEAKQKSLKSDCKEYQDDLMKTENIMIELRRKLADNSLQSNILLAIVNTAVTLVILGVTYFLPSIANINDSNSPVYSIQIILYCIAGIFGAVGIFFSFKAFSHYKKNAQFEGIKQEIEEYEIQKNELQNHMKDCKVNSERLSSKISELKKQIAEFN